MKALAVGLTGLMLCACNGYTETPDQKATSAASEEQAVDSEVGGVLKTDEDKLVYYAIYENLQTLQEVVPGDRDAIIKLAVDDFLADTPNRVSDAEYNRAGQAYAEKARAEQMAAKNAELERNLAEGEAFLEAKAKEDGVEKLESGLLIEPVVVGDGEKPTKSDTVRVLYHGTLIDGTVFDSAKERGEPIEFPLNGVIAGWTEGLQHMPVGSTYMLYIPADLAYGNTRRSPKIGPGATLVFEVELLEIK